MKMMGMRKKMKMGKSHIGRNKKKYGAFGAAAAGLGGAMFSRRFRGVGRALGGALSKKGRPGLRYGKSMGAGYLSMLGGTARKAWKSGKGSGFGFRKKKRNIIGA